LTISIKYNGWDELCVPKIRVCNISVDVTALIFAPFVMGLLAMIVTVVAVHHLDK
jgi:hypothetical protein